MQTAKNILNVTITLVLLGFIGLSLFRLGMFFFQGA
jgi:hypothetical protein